MVIYVGVGTGISVGLGHSCSIAQNECPDRTLFSEDYSNILLTTLGTFWLKSV